LLKIGKSKKYLKEFCEYVDFTEERFYEVVDSFRSPYLRTKESG